MYKVDFGPTVTASEIVTLEIAKLNSGIDYTSDDILLQLFVDAVAYEIENYIGYPVLQRDSAVVTLRYWETVYGLPIHFNEITGITYKNNENQQVALAVDDDYDVFENELTLINDVPADFKGPITITGKAGYANADIPKDMVDAALLMFSERELFRENRPVKLNTAAQSKLRPYKKY
jgi:hypothetical protein